MINNNQQYRNLHLFLFTHLIHDVNTISMRYHLLNAAFNVVLGVWLFLYVVIFNDITIPSHLTVNLQFQEQHLL